MKDIWCETILGIFILIISIKFYRTSKEEELFTRLKNKERKVPFYLWVCITCYTIAEIMLIFLFVLMVFEVVSV